jgi:enamine deaminase RidA (YjgF/YER057c/UK114 family)
MSSVNTSPEARLAKIGLFLPNPAPFVANYIPYVITGKTLYISGQIPFLNGEKIHIGRVGDKLTQAEGYAAARACGLNILAQVKSAVGDDWSKVKRCVKLGGFVNSTPDFDQHPAVINGASDVMVAALDDRGRHARFAVGASNLPFGVAVEVDAIFELI